MRTIIFQALLFTFTFQLQAQTDSGSVRSLSPVAQEDPSASNVRTTQEVTIISTRANQRDPTTFQNLSKEELQRNNLGQDLPYLLDGTPSLVTTSDAGTGVGYTGMRIRGTDASRINVTVNGVPVNDAESQNVYWVDLPDIASSTHSLQIQRGVGSSTNGSGAFGGSVNLRTDAMSLRPYGEVSTSFGSFNTLKHTLKAGTGLIKNLFFAEARGSYLTSDGYVDRASSRLWSYYVAMGIVHKKAMLKFVHFNGHEKTYQSWYGVIQDSLKTNRRYNVAGTDYGAAAIPWYNQIDLYGQQYFQLVYSQGIGKHWLANVTGFTTLGSGYYEEYKVAQTLTDYHISDPSQTNADLVRRLWLKNVFYGAVYSLQYDNQKNLDVTLGGMAGQYSGRHYGNVIWVKGLTVPLDQDAQYYHSKSLKSDFNMYLKLNYRPVKVLSLYADLQYRFVAHAMTGDDDGKRQFDIHNHWHFFNPKAGIAIIPKESFKIYASYAMANREPSRDDIIENLGIGAPKSERMHDIEAGIEWTKLSIGGENVRVNFPVHLNGYYMGYVDQLVLTGRLNDVGNPIRVNVPESYRAGVELSGQIVFSISDAKYGARARRNIFGIMYNASYNLSRINNYTEYVPAYDSLHTPVISLGQTNQYSHTDIAFSPRWVGYLALRAQPIRNLEIDWSFKFISRQYLDNTQSEERSLKPYWYSHIRLSYLYTFQKKRDIRFTLLFNNIFNRLYESNGYTYRERYVDASGAAGTPVSYNSYYPQAGFNMMAGVELRF